MDEASERNAEVVCISSGGQLREEAAIKGHKLINIPNLALARASLPYLIMPGLKLINPLIIIIGGEEKNITATELLEETVTHFLKENKKLQPNCHPDPFVNSLQSLFRHIYHSIVYAWNPDPYSDIAYSLAVIII
ncbi:MAG: hypothetical protein WBE34_14150 [Candidatus Nitrosopolaris sp.]